MSKWPMVALEELMADRIESVDPSKHPDELFDLYSVPSFDQRHPEKCFGSEIGSSKKLVQPGDVLLSRIVPHIRRSWVVADDDGQRLIASGEWIVFRSSRIDPTWLSHTLVGDTFHTKFMQTVAGVGGSLMRARPSHVASIQIPLPPMQEQRRIAAVLDQTSALRSKRRAAMAQVAKLEAHLFLEMFGHFTKPRTTVRDLAAKASNSVRTGPFGSQLLHSEFTDQGVAVLGIDNVIANTFRWNNRRYITDAKFAQLKRYQVFSGDVLISIMGTCGRCAVVPENIPLAINTKHLCCITLNRSQMIPEFLRAYFLYHPIARSYLSQKTKGAIMAGLNMGIILDTPVTVPPIAEQQHYAQALRKFSVVSANLEESSIQLDALFASLQARAFAGEL